MPRANQLNLVADNFIVSTLERGNDKNMVTPGMIWPDPDVPRPSSHPSEHARRTPMERIATADDVAKACVFFASDLADFVTGANLPVCGGMVMQ